MDSDELAMPVYSTLTQATKAKLAALPKGELMVRHPHFTQPIFVRFPRPAVLAGREGVIRFPPAPEVPFPQAVARRLRALDPGVNRQAVVDLVTGRHEDDVRKALHATERSRPADPLSYFRACLGKVAPAEAREVRRPVRGIRTEPDPYA
jgi:hypothetical protein